MLKQAAQAVVNVLWRVANPGVRMSDPLHDGAVSPLSRRGRNWFASSYGINSIVTQDSAILRDRAREMTRRNVYAGSALDSLVANMIGCGIKPMPVGLSDTQKKAWRETWTAWCDESDADGRSDFYGQQALVVRSMIEGGEVFVRRRLRRMEDGLTVPLQLQLLESEMLDATLNMALPNGNVIQQGIEFNSIGQRVNYHFYKTHPGEANTFFANGMARSVVPASDVAHAYRLVRIGQNRGLPWLTQVLLRLHELDKYDDAELVRKQIGAMFAAFITRDADSELMGEDDNGDGTADLAMEPGTFVPLEPGEDVKFPDLPDTGAGYADYMRVQLQAIAAGAQNLYENVTGDLKNVNYSSIRAGLLEFRRKVEMFQHQIIVFQFCRPVYAWFMDAAVLSGALRLPGYAAAPAKFRKVKWIAPGWPWVDPLKDINATKEAIKAGLMSRDEAVSSRGLDVEDVDAEVARDFERSTKLGLRFDTDPVPKETKPSTPPGAEKPQPEDGEDDQAEQESDEEAA